MTRRRWKRALVLALPFGWMSLFFLLPFLILLRISFSESRIGIPPYTDIIQWGGEMWVQINANLSNYAFLLDDSLYASAVLSSLRVAALSTLICLLIGYPMALGIARTAPPWRNLLLMLVILPFWTSFLIRVYAWIGLLKNEGLFNHLLMSLGVIDQPLPLLHSAFAVHLGIVYSYLPFMVLPLYATLERMDHALIEAAADLGCRPFRSFLSITLPLSMPGVIAGSMLVFIPAIGEFVIPDLLGGSSTLMIGKVLWTEFFNNRDWPLASAVAVVLLILLVAPLTLWQRRQLAAEEKQS
ncbi:ABC transporter permease subunit [Magnetospira thiophila]